MSKVPLGLPPRGSIPASLKKTKINTEEYLVMMEEAVLVVRFGLLLPLETGVINHLSRRGISIIVRNSDDSGRQCCGRYMISFIVVHNLW